MIELLYLTCEMMIPCVENRATVNLLLSIELYCRRTMKTYSFCFVSEKQFVYNGGDFCFELIRFVFLEMLRMSMWRGKGVVLCEKKTPTTTKIYWFRAI